MLCSTGKVTAWQADRLLCVSIALTIESVACSRRDSELTTVRERIADAAQVKEK